MPAPPILPTAPRRQIRHQLESPTQRQAPRPSSPGPVTAPPIDHAALAAEHHAAVQVVHHLVTGGLTHLPQPRTVGYAFHHLTDSEKATYGPLLLHRYVHFAGSPPEVLRKYEGTGPTGKPPPAQLREAKAVAAQQGEQTQAISQKLTAQQIKAQPGAPVTQIRRQQRRFVRAFTPHTVRRGISSKEAGLAGEIALAAVPGGLPFDALRGGGRILEALRGGKRAEEIASGTEKAAQAGKTARGLRAGVRAKVTAPVRAAGKAASESRAGRVVSRAATETKVGRAAVRGAKVAKPAARVGSYPFRHPTKFTVRAQVPETITSGDPRNLGAAFTGTGVAAHALGSVGSFASGVPLAGNILKDAFNLPATAIPSVYLPLRGAVQLATTGDDSELKSLLDQYSKNGLLPAIFRGDPAGALRAIKNHPLYSALEASGAYAVAGRGAGTALRAGGVRAARTERAPLHVYGARSQHREYSKNIITKAAQVANAERIKRGAFTSKGPRNPNVATAKEAQRYLGGAKIEGHRRGAVGVIHRFIEKHELGRREARHRVLNEHVKAAPKRAPRDAVVAEVAQGSIRPHAFHADLQSRVAQLQEQARSGTLSGPELDANRTLTKQLLKAETASPRQVEEIARSALTYAVDHNITTDQAVARGLYDPGQVERARTFPYAMRHMGATHGVPQAVTDRLAQIEQEVAVAKTREGRRAAVAAGIRQERTPTPLKALKRERKALKKTKPRLLTPNGETLTTEVIHAHMRANGINPEEVGFLTHAPGITGSRSFNQRAHSRSQLSRKIRTGEAFRKGAYDASYEALGGQRAFTQGIVDRAKTWDSLIQEFGMRAPNGGYWSNRSQAENYAAGYGGHVPLVPLEISPWLSLRRELEQARASGKESAKLDPNQVDRIQQGIDHSLTAEKGRFVLAPQEVVDQLHNHFQAANVLQRGAQSITQAFKYTVLPTSDKWILGNVLDQGTRAAFSGINPIPGASLYGRVARKQLAAIERLHGKETRAEIERQALSGGNYAQRANYRVNEASSGLAMAAHRVAQLPVAKQAAWLYGKYANAVFAGNGWMERQMELAGFGKAVVEDMRAHNVRFAHALTVQQGALDDLARGFVNTDRQVAFAHSVEDIFGRWRGNSPMARAVITGYAPFYLWARNASRFILLTLPAKHPVKTALIAAAATATEKERKKLGLDLFTEKPLPGFLQGAIPSGQGGLIPTQYYSSFGVFENYPGFVGNIVLPQIGGTSNALSGLSWSGQQLTNKDGTPITDPTVLAGLGINSFAESMIPFLSIARRTAEGGGSSAPTSTIFNPQALPHTAPKGGSLLGGLERVYVPRAYPKSTVGFLRQLSQERTIHIPAHSSGSSGSSSSSTPPWLSSSGSSSSDTPPWLAKPGSTSTTPPWLK